MSPLIYKVYSMKKYIAGCRYLEDACKVAAGPEKVTIKCYGQTIYNSLKHSPGITVHQQCFINMGFAKREDIKNETNT